MQVLASMAQENVCHVPQAQPALEAEDQKLKTEKLQGQEWLYLLQKFVIKA